MSARVSNRTVIKLRTFSRASTCPTLAGNKENISVWEVTRGAVYLRKERELPLFLSLFFFHLLFSHRARSIFIRTYVRTYVIIPKSASSFLRIPYMYIRARSIISALRSLFSVELSRFKTVLSPFERLPPPFSLPDPSPIQRAERERERESHCRTHGPLAAASVSLFSQGLLSPATTRRVAYRRRALSAGSRDRKSVV